MAKVKLNPVVVEIRGAVGDLVFRRSKKGEAVISQRPRMSNAEPSEAQKAQRERFALANEYAKAALADPDVRAHYEELAAQEGKGAFAAARTDYLKGRDLLSSPLRP